jgi:hypothetical protein
MYLITIKPLTINIPMQAAKTAVGVQLNTLHVNTDGSSTIDYSLVDASGNGIYNNGYLMTYTQLKTAGFDLAAMTPALQAIMLAGLGAALGP